MAGLSSREAPPATCRDNRPRRVSEGLVPKNSVVICAHNPRPDYLERTLAALRAQTLPRDAWELLLIDNASTEPLSELHSLDWHPTGRHIRELQLGLTPARLRGIAEADGDLLVFVDDDNVLAPDFLAEAVRIGETHPFLGAWGGSALGEFDTEPESWTRPYLHELTIREVRRPVWSSNIEDLTCVPFGAGLCIRKAVAERYAAALEASSDRKSLGRRGASLMSGEDLDMVLMCPALGLGFGLFPELTLQHLIPPARHQEDYLARLVYAKAFSQQVLMAAHAKPKPAPSWPSVALNLARTFAKGGRRHARMAWSRVSGHRAALRQLATGAVEGV